MDWKQNALLVQWVEKAVTLCRPKSVHICDGSEEEYQKLTSQLVDKGVFVPLNPRLRPNSFWCHSDPSDVARVEDATYICSNIKEDAGPTNHWKDPVEMHLLLDQLFDGCMEGRIMYVIAFCMGPLHSSMSRIGVQITDSPYVVCNMRMMTRMGQEALQELQQKSFIPCMHSVGVPLKGAQQDVVWPCRADQKYIVHFPEEKSIWSFGSGYGGNALLGKKSLALRIGSVMGRDEGWLAEHMLIMGITNPEGRKKYFAAAFPSACGKTNLAMLQSALPGWKIECVGDDIAWMCFKEDGQLYAINPEAGFFGVAPGTSITSNPSAMQTISKNAIFTNTALSEEGDVWWEKMTPQPPNSLIDWQGKLWRADGGSLASHPNARFTVSAKQCPVLDPEWESPHGVPISGIIFGGRCSHREPLVYESFNWQHGVFLGAAISSETTAAATGKVGQLRHDPFAMLPFCGYHMGDYFAHWLQIAKDKEKAPRIFHVNWFLKEGDRLLWPGFGENTRVLKWMWERADHQRSAQTTPIGYIPYPDDLDLSGLSISAQDVHKLLDVDRSAWKRHVTELREYFSLFGTRLPPEICQEIDSLEQRLI